MGRAKEYMMEQQEEKADMKLATILGITYDELLELNHKVEEHTGNDDVLYGYNVYFDEDSPQEILDKINRLDDNKYVFIESHELDDASNYDEYDYYEQYDAIISNKDYYESFKTEIKNIRKLNDLVIENFDLNNIQKRMLYVATIGTLEAFLSETFINQIKEKDEYLRNFIETFPTFKDQKFSINEIYTSMDKLHEMASREILNVLYHKLYVVKNMYQDTFKITFPDINKLSKAVIKRHDIVHRNGKTKEGDNLIIEESEVDELLMEVLSFGMLIAQELNLINISVEFELI